MKKAGICGHFGFGLDLSNGQTIKTKIIAQTLTRLYGQEQVELLDSHGGIRAVPGMVLRSLTLFRHCRNILMLPAKNGLRVFAPLYDALNRIYHRRLHYIVIGGWLDDYLQEHPSLIAPLRRFAGIYVETHKMKADLQARGFTNVFVMPNFKELPELSREETDVPAEPPFALCTFSRVSKEKGIEDAIEAVKAANLELNRPVFRLTIYGQIDRDYAQRWEALSWELPDGIRYGGIVPYDKSVDTLKHYFALLFPTRYAGEGFAGTLLDAMAAGLPVVASDWKYNGEIVRPGKTGVLIRDCNAQRLCGQLLRIAEDPQAWAAMRGTALEEARKYRPCEAIRVLTRQLD